jgi:hypothetical protein
MIEKLKGLFFAVAGAAQTGRRTDSAEIAAAENDPANVTFRQQFPASAPLDHNGIGALTKELMKSLNAFAGHSAVALWWRGSPVAARWRD